MTPDDAKQVLDFLKQSAAQSRDNLRKSMESHSDHADRVIGQMAQLKILNEHQSPVEILASLREVAAGENPL